MRIAIVTGASSGLGREYVLTIGRKEKNIDEIWVIARRQALLDGLVSLSPVSVRPLPADLTDAAGIALLKNELQKAEPDVALLINAAGFGRIGNYQEVTEEESLRMIDLNCKAAVSVTYACLPYMKRGGRILQICSTAAFQPFPFLNVYSATKAFLYRFSRALRMELLPRGISVTAVCPYWVKDTEFISTARQTEGEKRQIRHYPLASRTSSVVRVSYFMARLRLPVSTPGIVCTLHWIAGKVIPSDLLMGVWALLRRI